MLHLLLFAILSLTELKIAQGQSTAIYDSETESEDSEKASLKTFSARVKTIREESDGVDVFFADDKYPGTYSLSNNTSNYGIYIKYLRASKKNEHEAVSITVDKEKRIKSVEKATTPSESIAP